MTLPILAAKGLTTGGWFMMVLSVGTVTPSPLRRLTPPNWKDATVPHSGLEGRRRRTEMFMNLEGGIDVPVDVPKFVSSLF